MTDDYSYLSARAHFAATGIERHPQLSRACRSEQEILREYADYCVRVSAQPQALTEYAFIAAESSLPKAVTERCRLLSPDRKQRRQM
jgi:hypothetical protein